MKIQTKVTLLFSLLCISIIVALSLAVSYFSYKNASQDFYTRLELRARIAARAMLEKDEGTAAFSEIRNQHLQKLPNEREYFINVDTVGEVRHNVINNEVPESFIREIVVNDKATYRKDFSFYEGIHYSTGGKKYIVIVAAENTFLKSFLINLNKILITGCIISVVLVLTSGLLFSKQILAPVRNITRQVRRITATSLHLRLNAKPGKDEIAALSNTFNDMLSRLETAFESQNNFVSNASHELNTPLTAIIGEADYALARSRSEEQYRQSLTVIMQQGEKLKGITESLVQLARAGFTENLTMSRVSLAELIHNALNNVHHVYSNSNITTTVDEILQDASLTGNQQLLELALSNILLNACKYSNNQPVTMSVTGNNAAIYIVVKDVGIGIPKDELKNIYDPFFRASNAKTMHGYGIGLPLTRNILRLHKGSIDVDSAELAGTTVKLSLPRN